MLIAVFVASLNCELISVVGVLLPFDVACLHSLIRLFASSHMPRSQVSTWEDSPGKKAAHSRSLRTLSISLKRAAR